ncbi:MAG: hypothetical protein QOJ89_825 [bacterium]|jgi:hypothetical protein
MANGEILRRLEAEVARTNEILEQERVAWKSQMAEHGSSLQDIRFEMRQMSVRGERIAQSYVRAIDALTDEMRASGQAFRSELKDMSAETRANTQAVLRLLDRFDAGGGPAAAAG